MGGGLSRGLLTTEAQFLMLILRSVESETTSRENQPLGACLQMNQRGEYPCVTALHLRGNFASGNPIKILSHLRILEQGPVRAYGTPPEP